MPPFVTLVTATVRLRTVAVWGTITGATVGAGLLLAPVCLGGPGTTFVDLLTWGCAAAGLLAAALTWTVVTDVAVRVLIGTPVPHRRLGPLRLLVLLAFGIAAVGSPAAAHAPTDPVSDDRARDARAEEPPALSGLPLPDRPGGDPHLTARHPAGAPQRTVTVQRGDHLWGLARSQLGPDATEARIARQVRALHRRNAAVIGPDPNLILPGQRLVLPPAPGRDHR